MEGLILSIGGLTERLVRNPDGWKKKKKLINLRLRGVTHSIVCFFQVKHSSTSLFTYLKSIEDRKELDRILNSIIDIFNTYLYNIRVILPLFIFLDRLLGSGVIREVLEDNKSKFAEELYRLTKLEIARIRDYKKLVNSMDLFCQLVQVKKFFFFITLDPINRSINQSTIRTFKFSGQGMGVDESFKSNVGIPVSQIKSREKKRIE